MIDLLYMFATFRPKQFGVYKVYAAEELDMMISHYEHDLIEQIAEADAAHLTRIAQAFYIFKTDDFENVWWRIENRALELASELSGKQLTQIVRSFSHAQNNKMVAQEKTFAVLESHIKKNLAELSVRDLSHVMYAYAVRDAGSPDFHKAMLSQISSHISEMDYPTLHNFIYYLMFTENTDASVWKQVVENTVENPDVLPLVYYKPFKASYFYMKHHFSQWNEHMNEHGSFLSHYQDKFFHAEKYFNAIKLEDEYHQQKEYVTFRGFLTGHCNVYPTPFVTVHNLFNLHYVFHA